MAILAGAIAYVALSLKVLNGARTTKRSPSHSAR